jgi:manganese/zinc/iron transport system substrate-binding protein
LTNLKKNLDLTLNKLYMKQIFVLWFIITVSLCACNNQTSEQDGDKTLYIVTTTSMIRNAVENVVGDLARVEGLMGPGVDPHLYKATTGDLDRLREADIIFYNGLHLEGKMTDVLEKLGRTKPVFAIGESILEDQLLVGGVNAHDPHIWFDVSLWENVVTYIREKMAAEDPENANVYTANAATYVSQLAALHQKIKTQIASVPKERRVLITAHDAFSYFGRAYDIEVRGLQGISTVSEFGLKDISELVSFITEKKIKAVFVESSVPAKSLEAVVSGCQERGHDVSIGGTLYSDAMGAEGTDAGTYMGMVEANVNTIVNALQ